MPDVLYTLLNAYWPHVLGVCLIGGFAGMVRSAYTLATKSTKRL